MEGADGEKKSRYWWLDFIKSERKLAKKRKAKKEAQKRGEVRRYLRILADIALPNRLSSLSSPIYPKVSVVYVEAAEYFDLADNCGQLLL